MNLEVKQLSGGYGARLVLDGVEFSVRSGSIVTIIGPNGSGKSTLLKMIGRVLRPQAGSIILDGRSIAAGKTDELAKILAMLPQNHHAATGLTVEELVSYGRYPHRRPFGFLSGHDRHVVDEVLSLTRLHSLRRRAVNTLSGGERQRAWIAMTLAQQPQLLLLDEPLTFLDVCCQLEIIDLVRQLNHQRGITVVMVLHDLNLAASCSDALIMLKAGKIHCVGTPSAVMTADNLRKVFAIHARIILTENGTPYCLATGSARTDDLTTE